MDEVVPLACGHSLAASVCREYWSIPACLLKCPTCAEQDTGCYMEVSADGNESPVSYFRMDEDDRARTVVLARTPFIGGSSLVKLPADVSTRNLAMLVILTKIKEHRDEWCTVSISPAASFQFLQWWQEYARQSVQVNT